ncbi:uncharacterized protein HMPREF1541_07650 [Cyphellophora europaea CBS 101466]|uniref:Mediator of RNA polymerase II transcription subunit 18 n=1 Tax=Cyphellophora europaea (strain CBS 101466) TaxID=1220924 RepID=W2RNI6_CYPE1|nr:uncharacterized protein HMPREF1541_07650 [Cyphellophora europaea CBS 101466]ETN38027.1 hypothetical protein HMPREF1541_07650 [Cyphellophora europaea CBS 101466]
MHEFSLYGQIPQNEQPRLLQQLVGVTRMKPQAFQELHLVFRSQVPSGIPNIPSSGEASTKQDVQRIAKMLTANLYFVQVIGEIEKPSGTTLDDADMANNDDFRDSQKDISWYFEFKDTPDPGKQAVSGRLLSRIPIEDGNIVKFMKSFGYDYVNRYLVKGDRFYDQDTTLSLHQLYRIPEAKGNEAEDWSFAKKDDAVSLFDISGAYILHVSIEAVDGSKAELKDRASAQLLAMRDTLKQAVALTPGDRLALDTRGPARR